LWFVQSFRNGTYAQIGGAIAAGQSTYPQIASQLARELEARRKALDTDNVVRIEQAKRSTR